MKRNRYYLPAQKQGIDSKGKFKVVKLDPRFKIMENKKLLRPSNLTRIVGLILLVGGAWVPMPELVIQTAGIEAAGFNLIQAVGAALVLMPMISEFVKRKYK